MKQKKNLLFLKETRIGYLYFYIHFVVEVLCFFTLSRVIGNTFLLWMVPLFYDLFAFVPQAIIGYISDKHRNIPIGYIGYFLLLLGFLLFHFTSLNLYISLFLLCIGNAFLHVDGAECTLRCSDGKMSPAAIFVSGGSFGVVCGKLLGSSSLSFLFLVFFSLSVIPCLILGRCYQKENGAKKCYSFSYHNPKIKVSLFLLLTTLVVMIRGYMGYGIPTSWNKTVIQTILLYSFMGLGKALGGILIDLIGMRKTAFISVILGLPFLLFGDQLMLVSLIGVMLFSMTMAVTLGLLVSALQKTPGLAFGYTTIGLFLGTVPIFFVRFQSLLVNNIIITLLSILCLFLLFVIIKKEERCG